jgi:hypothetical protein
VYPSSQRAEIVWAAPPRQFDTNALQSRKELLYTALSSGCREVFRCGLQ